MKILLAILLLVPSIGFCWDRRHRDIFGGINDSYATRDRRVNQVYESNARWAESINRFRQQKHDREVLEEMKRRNELYERYLLYLCSQDPNCHDFK